LRINPNPDREPKFARITQQRALSPTAASELEHLDKSAEHQLESDPVNVFRLLLRSFAAFSAAHREMMCRIAIDVDM
jgi:hypothetical protein